MKLKNILTIIFCRRRWFHVAIFQSVEGVILMINNMIRAFAAAAALLASQTVVAKGIVFSQAEIDKLNAAGKVDDNSYFVSHQTVNAEGIVFSQAEIDELNAAGKVDDNSYFVSQAEIDKLNLIGKTVNAGGKVEVGGNFNPDPAPTDVPAHCTRKGQRIHCVFDVDPVQKPARNGRRVQPLSFPDDSSYGNVDVRVNGERIPGGVHQGNQCIGAICAGPK